MEFGNVRDAHDRTSIDVGYPFGFGVASSEVTSRLPDRE
jgi:hypothetical protein